MTTPTRQPSSLPRDLRTGLLHLGLGAFHRAHQAAYTEDAIAAAGGNWGIEAVSMRNPDLADALTAQNGRFTLIERHPGGPVLREISVIRAARALSRDPAAVVARLADPAIHVVTITVTEKGYGFDPATRGLDRSNPIIAHDLQSPDRPRGVIGTLVAGLAARRDAGGQGMTLLSCDNLPENGTLLERLVCEFATLRDPALAGWIEEQCRFPDSMIDRITPAATDATFALARAATGRNDPLAIETEPFRQWVIEDRFAGPRPAWEQAGALIVPDVTPFETMKLRMLNGAHSLIAYAGTTAGLAAVRDVMAEPAFRALVTAHMASAATTVPPAAGFDLASYASDLIARFSNPAIEHLCLQIAMDGSQKLPQRIFAPAAVRLERGQDIGSFAFATALWLLHIGEKSETGTTWKLDDPMSEELKRAVAAADPETTVAAVFALPGLGGIPLLSDPVWKKAVAAQLARLRRIGVRSAAAHLLNVD